MHIVAAGILEGAAHLRNRWHDLHLYLKYKAISTGIWLEDLKLEYVKTATASTSTASNENVPERHNSNKK